MKISQTLITQLVISELKDLDPVRVIIENIKPGVGSITLTCFGKSWTASWGAMSDRSVQEFFMDCNNSYLINCLDRGISSVIDGEDNAANIEFVRKEICLLRRSGELSRDESREFWEETEGADDVKEKCCSFSLGSPLLKLFGDEPWYADWPAVPNPDYEYLKRIVQAVREALQQSHQAAA